MPLVLLRLKALPQSPLSISPFELMYGWLVLTPSLSPKTSPLPDHLLTSLLSHLCSLLWDFTDYSLCQPRANLCPLQIKIGDQVLFSPPDQCLLPLSPKWQGPFKVILVTPTAAKLKGLPHGIHLSHLKPSALPAQDTPSYMVT